jgi:hypothetical protein
MRLNKILSLALIATFFAATSSQAFGQRTSIGIGFNKIGKSSSLRVGIGIGGVIRHGGHGHGGGLVIVDPYPARCWVPGYYQTVCEQVWVPGCETQVWCEPVYQTICDPCCPPRQVLVTAGFYKTVVTAGRFETRHRQVWVPGFYR